LQERSFRNFEIDCILSKFRHEYYAHEYDLIYNNCNHFTKQFCKELCNYKLPRWINRAARVGRRLNLSDLIAKSCAVSGSKLNKKGLMTENII